MNIVRIRLRKPRRVLPFLCNNIFLNRDETCIVETDQGLEWGTCILPPEPCSPEAARGITQRVVRKTTDADKSAYSEMEQEEKKAYALCLAHIEKRNLPMQLVDVEYTFDRHKVTFYFTAENRVDFRELVRDLARELHSRIELRHIQVRDRSKLVGGLGCCGRILCCNSFLDDFVPISMRMAKCQNLSLNPNKISGQCGRLLCCLNYESEVYERGDIRPCAAPPIPDADYNASPQRRPAAPDAPRERKRPPQRIVVEAPEKLPEDNAPTSDAGGNDAQKKRNKKKRGKRKKGKGDKGAPAEA